MSVKHSSFIKNSSRAYFMIPALPFSIWHGDTLLWASDERHARRLTADQRAAMANAEFFMNDKIYTVVGDARHEDHAILLARMIQTSVSGEKDKEPFPLLSIYHMCKTFFTNELSTAFRFSCTDIPSWVALECGVPFMFALLLTVYPILCKDPMAAIDIHFDCKHESTSLTITPHCEIDLENDILHGDFISVLLSATIENADFSMSEIISSEGKKSICLSSKNVSHVKEALTLNASTELEVQYLFAFFLSLCTQYNDPSQ